MRRICLASICAALALALLVPATSFAGSGLRFFHTADGNIDCGMVKGKKKKRHRHPRLPGEARCDVRTHTWTAPPKPKFCELDWGNGVFVGDKGFGRYVCAGDTVAQPGSPVLAAGAAITLGRYTCTASSVSVRCTNNLTGHGFEVSADSVSLF